MIRSQTHCAALQVGLWVFPCVIREGGRGIILALEITTMDSVAVPSLDTGIRFKHFAKPGNSWE